MLRTMVSAGEMVGVALSSLPARYYGGAHAMQSCTDHHAGAERKVNKQPRGLTEPPVKMTSELKLKDKLMLTR